MAILIIFGALSFIFGMLFLLNKDSLKKLEAALNKPVIMAADVAEGHPQFFGVVMIILSFVLFYLAWKFRR